MNQYRPAQKYSSMYKRPQGGVDRACLGIKRHVFNPLGEVFPEALLYELLLQFSEIKYLETFTMYVKDAIIAVGSHTTQSSWRTF